MTLKSSTGGPNLHGSKTTGTTATRMAESLGEQKLAKGILVKAAASNTGTIYVGSENVSADGGDTNSGFPLAASESLFIPSEDLDVWIIATVADQDVFWIAK